MFVGGRGEFKLNKTVKSFNFAGDDIWPRMVRIEFALAEMETSLKEDLGASASQFTVHDRKFATGHGEIFNVLMKIGPEWVRVLSRDYQDVDTFLIDRRGRRGTARVNHAAETPVYFGRVYDVTVLIPSFRDDNN